MSSSFQQVLATLREKSHSTVDQGRYFERLVAFYLKNDPLYKNRFAEVLSYAEWQHRRGEPANDVGIDLVAVENNGDEKSYWAIQAKFYAEGTPIQRQHVDTFFTASGKKPFTHRLFVSTTDNWGANAEKALSDQTIPCIRIGMNELSHSSVQWENFIDPQNPVAPPRFAPRPHQQEAINAVCAGLQKADRGRLIMACGTGKTYTSLKIAERLAPHDGYILFLVPSLSLLSQSLREWAEKTDIPLRNFIVCSDIKVGHTDEDINIHDLALPATLKPALLGRQLCRNFSDEERRLNVVFCTYHSIGVVAQAQKEHGAPDFDLVICDEAHRTTGVEGKASEKRYFTAVHDAAYLRAKKRLYMTATPRLYKGEVQAQAKEQDIVLCSMDNTAQYGEELHRLGFSEAVRQGLLSDYKVLILATQKPAAATQMQNTLAQNGELNLDDAARLIGCWNGLAKRRHPNDNSEFLDPLPMRRAVAFTQTIKYSQMACNNFNNIVQQYLDQEPADAATLICETDHVDGSMNALQRNHKLQWLKDDPHQSDQYAADKNYCRILSNARCLSEGVDVPALDAVMFLNPRKSQVDVVQAVGRVMRKAEGKKEGYVILPIAITADTEPDQALNNNKSYKVVWQVLQALRAHDENFNAVINKIDLNDNKPGKIQIIGVPYSGADDPEADPAQSALKEIAPLLPFEDFDKWRDAIYARIVLKCGDRRYWETWAKDVASIAQTNIIRIRALLAQSDAHYRELFDEFLQRLRQNLNPAVSEEDAIEMLSQHLITRPVFAALFEDYAFADKNPVSKTMQAMLDLLDQEGLQKETEPLQQFYDSVKERAGGIDNAAGKQRIMLELYEKFFSTAFKKDAQRLGIVYTPVEAVDFILASADAALSKEFGKRLSDKNIHILDPFTGTGTFIARLLQSDLLADKNLSHKYAHELHANEIALLAYYIAAINIEEAYHHRHGGDYQPFEGIVLTDTFQMTESGGGLLDNIFPINSARGKKQRNTPIRVIIGNPPYSAGQRSANDNNPNLSYPMLDEQIKETYVRLSSATNKNSLYDSYIRALRWATDRVGEEGIIAFITNGSFIDSNAANGLRKSLIDDFTAIYCLNMRGNARTSGEQRRMEKDNIFGQGTRTPVAITLFVKKKDADKKPATLHYHDIGDYLTRGQKLDKLRDKNYSGINWQIIKPNKVGDWINQSHPEFSKFMPMGAKKEDEKISIFQSYCNGLGTTRDSWAYNFGKDQVAQNMASMIDFYNAELERYKKARADGDTTEITEFVNRSPNKISWSRGLLSKISRGTIGSFNASSIRTALYRPFTKQHLYYDKVFTDLPAIARRFFPTDESENVAISVVGDGSSMNFSALMTNIIPDFHLLSGSQCFPLYNYVSESGELGGGQKFTRRDNITDEILKKFRAHYRTDNIKKEDIFYYVYGVLHSPAYKERYQADLRKMLPHLPMAANLADFFAFAAAGRKLGKLHVDYEQAEEYPLSEHLPDMFAESDYEVKKMRYLSAAAIAGKIDKSAIKYNETLHLSGIPAEAYQYEINGKTPIGWIMERYQRTIHKESGIANNPNDWSDDPKYIVSLLKKVVYVSVETAKIIRDLPNLPMG